MKTILFGFLLCAPLLAADKPRIVYWTPGDPNCRVFYSNGVGSEMIIDPAKDRGVSANVPVLRDKHLFLVTVDVINNGKQPVDLNPENIGGLSDENPPSVMKSIDAMQKIAKEERSANRRAALAAGLSGFSAGYNANTTATATGSDGSITTVTVHDPNAVRRANEDAAADRAVIKVNSQGKRVWVLQRNTVLPESSVIGDVFIERPKGMDKHAKMGQFVVDLGDTIYIFPFVNGAIPIR